MYQTHFSLTPFIPYNIVLNSAFIRSAQLTERKKEKKKATEET